MEQNLSRSEEQRFLNVGNVLRDFRQIHTFIFDVDGVLTNGDLLITEKGELLRTMNVRDGFAMKRAVQENFKIFIITGGSSEGTINRLKALGVTKVIAGAQNKLKYYEALIDEYHLEEEGILFMGDDLPDYEIMRRVGLPCCPQDAVPEILEICKYISPLQGGKGCVRDVLEKVLKLKGVW